MSDETEDRNGDADEATESAGEQPVDKWSEPTPGPRWSEIASEAGPPSSGSGGSGQADDSEGTQEPSPGTEGSPSRRPTSLRFGSAPAADLPRRRLTPPAFPDQPSFRGRPSFPSQPSFPGQTSSAAQPSVPSEPASQSPPEPPPSQLETEAPVSEASFVGNSGQVPNSAKSLREKLPTGKLPLDKLPLDKVPLDKLKTDKLQALVRQRPEVGVGLAFAGGLVIATIIRRLGR